MIKLIIICIAVPVILMLVGAGYQRTKQAVASDAAKFGRRDPLTWLLIGNAVLIGGAFLLAAVLR